MNSNNERIESLQTVRFLAFMVVFLVHADIIDDSLGGLGVSIFLVLSGFVMMYAYWNKQLQYSIKYAITFSIKKIKKLYPLHILTMVGVLVLMIPNLLSDFSIKLLVKVASQVIANVFLLKAFIPRESIYFSLNGVSWYLSVCLFLYMLFPFIQKYLKRCSIKKALRNVVVAYIIQVIFVVIIYSLKQLHGISNETISGLTYISPFFRTIDFFVGTNLCVIFKENRQKYKNSIYTFGEVIFVMSSIITIMVYLQLQSFKGKGMVEKIWGRSAVMFLPISFCLIYLFAINKGKFSKILTNKLTIYIGNISAYTFLIHTVVIRYVDALTSKFNICNGEIEKAFVSFTLTVIASLMYIKIHKIRILRYRRQ